MFSKVHSSQFTPKARLAEGGTVHRFKKTDSCPPLTVNRKAGGFTLIELIIVNQTFSKPQASYLLTIRLN